MINPQEVVGILTKLVNERKQLIKFVEISYSTLKELHTKTESLTFTSTVMMNLLQDLMDLARIDIRKFQLNNDHFDLFEVIRKTFVLVKPFAVQKNILLKEPIPKENSEKYFRQIFSDE